VQVLSFNLGEQHHWRIGKICPTKGVLFAFVIVLCSNQTLPFYQSSYFPFYAKNTFPFLFSLLFCFPLPGFTDLANDASRLRTLNACSFACFERGFLQAFGCGDLLMLTELRLLFAGSGLRRFKIKRSSSLNGFSTR